MAENGKIDIKIDVNEALRQIGTAFSIVGEKIRDWLIILFPCKAKEAYKRLVDHVLNEWEYAQKILNDRQIPPALQRKLSDKFGDAWIRNAPLEDNQDLQHIWARLLANAMDPNFDLNAIHPAFLGIIKEMTPLEAQFLNEVYQILLQKGMWDDFKSCLNASINISNVTFPPEITTSIVQTSIENLERNKLITTLQSVEGMFQRGESILDGVASRKNAPSLTALGVSFIRACIEEKKITPSTV
jgi:hypothetical protein